MIEKSLNGIWGLREVTWENFIDAKVPGDVYNDLLNADLMEDPFYRENEWDALELSRNDYEYITSFEVTEELRACEKILLSFSGIDTIAEINLNGKKISNTNNMHREYEFDVKELLWEGENFLRVLLSSPIEYCEKKHNEKPVLERKDSLKGSYYLRKAHCMFGWDWGPRLPDMGIWRDVSLKGYNCGRIEEVYVVQNHHKDMVELDIRVHREAWTDEAVTIMLEIEAPNGNIISHATSSKEIEEHIKIIIENPMLWWPNGYGEQPLYKLRVELCKEDEILDHKEMKLGLRTVKVKREKDEWGESFTFVVNDVELFLMGADYIPEDNLLGRGSRERTEALLKSCIRANFNCIRVWGGGFYGENYFYDICDELGLLVWQDLMFACMLYDLNEEFSSNIKQELRDNVRRIRHHACLGIWCGNNEIEWGLSDNWIPDDKKAREDYLNQFNVLIPEVLEKEDPNTFYWPSSPSASGDFADPNCDNIGDMHYWGVWHNTEPFTYYRKYYPRFMSEFGLQSFPSIKTVEAFTLPEDRNIFSPVMENHQKNSTCNAKILHYISETYRYPKSFEALLTVSQIIQAEGIKYGVEHFRRNRGRCMGAIYWQLNDCWPVASWSSIDYFGRWKALHYSAKRFYAPILISACEEETKVELHLTNETFKDIEGQVIWRLRDKAGRLIKDETIEVNCSKFSSKLCADLDFADIVDTTLKKRNTYLEFEFVQDGNVVSSGTVLFVKAKHFEFVEPALKVTAEEDEDNISLKITSEAFAKYVMIDFNDLDIILEDNYFDLSPGIIKSVRINKKDLGRQITPKELMDKLYISSLVDTYC